MKGVKFYQFKQPRTFQVSSLGYKSPLQLTLGMLCVIHFVSSHRLNWLQLATDRLQPRWSQTFAPRRTPTLLSLSQITHTSSGLTTNSYLTAPTTANKSFYFLKAKFVSLRWTRRCRKIPVQDNPRIGSSFCKGPLVQCFYPLDSVA